MTAAKLDARHPPAVVSALRNEDGNPALVVELVLTGAITLVYDYSNSDPPSAGVSNRRRRS